MARWPKRSSNWEILRWTAVFPFGTMKRLSDILIMSVRTGMSLSMDLPWVVRCCKSYPTPRMGQLASPG